MKQIINSALSVEEIFRQIEIRRPETHHEINFLRTWVSYLVKCCLENPDDPSHFHNVMTEQLKISKEYRLNSNPNVPTGRALSQLFREGERNLWIDNLLYFLLFLDSRHGKLFLS